MGISEQLEMRQSGYEEEMSNMIEGFDSWTSKRVEATVKWFDNAKGYGFAVVDQCPYDVFLHYRSIRGEDGFKTLSEGDQVYLLVLRSDKGLTGSEIWKLATMTVAQLQAAQRGADPDGY